MPWDPTLYNAFAQPRLRPALDLLARIDADHPHHVVDLGCGTGNVTRILAERWHDATITGVDSSPEMLAAASASPSFIRWHKSDIAQWKPERPADVVFSNAALQWLDGHEALFPALVAQLAPRGVLAVQMPHNHYAASHAVMADTVESGPWAARLRPLARRFPVHDIDVYYDILSPLVASLDIWETEYLHVLEGDNPVVQWTMGTALRPMLDALATPERDEFVAEYSRRIAESYPPRADGKTLFPFRRLFIVAKARA